MPPAERRALMLLLGLAVAGQGVHHLLTQPDQPAGGVQLLATLGTDSPRAQRDSAMRLGRPLAAGEKIDVDRAPAGELTRLPKVGPRLAKTIVADREAHGTFGSLEALDRVPGVGPGLLKAVEPHVAFSGAAGQRGGGAGEATGGGTHSNINRAGAAELDALPGIGPARARAIVRYREEHGEFSTLDELAHVPGLNRAVIERLRGRVVVR